MKKFLKIFVLALFFSILIFILKYYFSWQKNKIEFIEENFIEHSLLEEKIEDYVKQKKQDDEKKDNDLNSVRKYFFYYFPDYFEIDSLKYTKILNFILSSKVFDDKVIKLNLELYEKIVDARGKMKGGAVKLFWVLDLKESELVSVFIHEFAHYVDIYFLEKKVTYDLSNDFYSISWDSIKILKKWQTNKDFVSWYAMTNKYEDFAESYTYYVLHNFDFLKKAKKSSILMKKYDFFEKFIFRKSEFKETDFSLNNEVKGYYWDITKIDFSLENFLHYLKNYI